jgi:predicted nucleic acid-binding protein
MTLIDTSSWVDALRRDGDPEVKTRVAALMRAGTAAWCDIVRLELWSGLRGAAERKHMEELEADVVNLPTNDAVWARARLLTQRARAKEVTVPATDLLIAACAWEHGVALEHDDAHLTALAALFD